MPFTESFNSFWILFPSSVFCIKFFFVRTTTMLMYRLFSPCKNGPFFIALIASLWLHCSKIICISLPFFFFTVAIENRQRVAAHMQNSKINIFPQCLIQLYWCLLNAFNAVYVKWWSVVENEWRTQHKIRHRRRKTVYEKNKKKWNYKFVQDRTKDGIEENGKQDGQISKAVKWEKIAMART